MRISEASLALITRVNAQGETEYLTQWNEKWHAYSLIGGHREEGESFRECCIREVEEELGLTRDVDFILTDSPINPSLRFTGFSRSAQVDTMFVFELFEAMLCCSIGRLNDCHWVQFAEAKSGIAPDGRAIADQVFRTISHVKELRRTLHTHSPQSNAP